VASKNVNFYPDKKDKIDRRRQLAKILMEQGQQPSGTEVISGYAVKQSPLAGLARALTQGVGAYQGASADRMEDEMMAPQEAYGPALPSKQPSNNQRISELLQAPQIPYGPERPVQKAPTKSKGKKLAEALVPSAPAPVAPPLAPPPVQQVPMQAPPVAPVQQAPVNGMPVNPGVPEQAPDPFAGVQGRSRDALVNNVRQTAIKRMNDKDTIGQLNAARGLKDKMGRFEDLLEVQDTGGAMINTPVIGSAMKLFDPELNEMQSIQSELAPKMRVPGSGSSSDMDVQMFKAATIGPEKPKQTNENIAQAFSTAQQNLIDRDQFLRDYLDYHGHVQGAEQSWNDYLNNNPIFSPDSTPESPQLNPDRLGYREYFSGGKTGAPEESKLDKIKKHMASKGATPEQIEAFIAEQGVQ